MPTVVGLRRAQASWRTCELGEEAMRRITRLLRRKRPEPKTVTVVSGLPRSGTSMLMKMLEAGGMQVLIDGIREADVDNPRGYYEFERVKQLDKGDHGWLKEAEGKAVKVIAALLEHLPAGYSYRVVFVHRRMDEILASQRKMLMHRGEQQERVGDEEMASLFQKHVRKVMSWLQAQENFCVLEVDYHRLVENPRLHLQEIGRFLGDWLDVEKMAQVVDSTLYRNRSRLACQ